MSILKIYMGITKSKNLGICITGSFCTFKQILEEIKKIKHEGYNIIPIVSEATKTFDTRFYKASDFISELEEITQNKIVDTIVDAEPLGPKNMIDLMIVAPCTGNTLSKLANSITDNAVTMAVKAHMRNHKPVVIGISSNDVLGVNLGNLAVMLNQKNVFFVPFGQDDPIKKPKSIISDYSLILDTIKNAEEGRQIQPVLLRGDL